MRNRYTGNLNCKFPEFIEKNTQKGLYALKCQIHIIYTDFVQKKIRIYKY